ncbi:hypothetical protein PTKIN_Ptkin07bG0051400 [Pterospermum kingtungense]
MDEDTLNRRRLDYARILVSVNNKMIISAIFTVCVNGCKYKMAITIDEDDNYCYNGDHADNRRMVSVNSGSVVSTTIREDKKRWGELNFYRSQKGVRPYNAMLEELPILSSKTNKNSRVAIRIRKKVKKDIEEIIRIGSKARVLESDNSVSDEDIEARNSILTREEDSIVEIGTELGLFFDKTHEDMVEVFGTLEAES